MTPTSVPSRAALTLALGLLSSAAFAQGAASGAAGASPAAAAAPGTVDIGDLEIIPSRSSVTLSLGRRGAACVESNLKFRVRNKSAGDLKLLLFRANLSAADGSGKPLIERRYVTSGGLVLSNAPDNAMRSAFLREASKLITVAPKQTIEVQLNMPGGRLCAPDPDGQLMRTYRPKTMTLSGALGVVDVANNADIKSFSLLDVPVIADAR
ncbi:MAG: hypothetical protein JNM61_09490 [Zoogloeaceae bacterium]|nr:hypothetical protein [Zoogloeaceae bacterium]